MIFLLVILSLHKSQKDLIFIKLQKEKGVARSTASNPLGKKLRERFGWSFLLPGAGQLGHVVVGDQVILEQVLGRSPAYHLC